MGNIERHGKENKLKRIRFTLPNGKRKRLCLGKVTVRQAEEINRHVDELYSAKVTGYSISESTAHWLNRIDDSLQEKLVELELVAPRKKSTLAEFLNDYVTSRTDLKPSSVIHMNQSVGNLIEFFGRKRMLQTVNRGDADKFRLFLLNKGLAENTIRRRCGRAREFFNAAIKQELISKNPFCDLKVTLRAVSERFYFVTRSETAKILRECPSAEWRLIVSLCRYGGLRCPSEVLGVRWEDINWGERRVLIHSPKTEHHEGKESRMIPLFPELESALNDCWEQAETGATHCITRYRDAGSNLRTTFKKIIHRAGLEAWPKLFQNLRSTRQTELEEDYPSHVVCQWMGNSQSVAQKHYLQVTDDHFKRAIEQPEQPTNESRSSDPKTNTKISTRTRQSDQESPRTGTKVVQYPSDVSAIKNGDLQPNAVQCKSPINCTIVGLAGLEPAAKRL